MNAAQKGWRTRRARAAARLEAARKGWRTRRKRQRGVLVRLGYTSSNENSFVMEIEIATFRRLSDNNTYTLLGRLLRDGQFDEDSAEVGGPRDLQWTAGLINYEHVIKRNLKRTPGTAQLLSFDREEEP